MTIRARIWVVTAAVAFGSGIAAADEVTMPGVDAQHQAEVQADLQNEMNAPPPAAPAPADAPVEALAPAPAAMPAALPHKGQTMAAVERQFGAPQTRHAPVGGSSPRRPPITRWDYAGFSVFFENTHVVDAVVPGHPPQVHHVDQLQATAD